MVIPFCCVCMCVCVCVCGGGGGGGTLLYCFPQQILIMKCSKKAKTSIHCLLPFSVAMETNLENR